MARPGASVTTPSLDTTEMIRIRSLSPDVPQPERIVVRVVAGADMVQYAVLSEDEPLVVGRDAGCGLTLSHGSASRRHADLTLLTGGIVRVRDLGSTNGTWVDGERVRGAIAVECGDRVEVGEVGLRIERMTTHEIAHLERVAEKVRVASHDALTGLVTRGWLGSELPGVVDQHAATGTCLSCLFIDIDHFKSINDTFGHAAGDEVLRAVARLVVYAIRSADVAIRYGGEEIIVVLCGCDLARATSVAERIRGSVATHAWSAYGLGERRVTVSCGVAQIQHEEAAAEWLQRADRALYAAKHGGRNRTVYAS